MEQIYIEVINLLAVVITALLGWVTKHVVALLKRKGVIAQLESNKELVKIVVNGVEQAFYHLKGDEKLQLAKIEVLKLLEEKKVKISEKELDILIEAMVKEMNDKAREELDK